MPKRKNSKQLELEFLKWKTKKVERELARKHSRKHKKQKREEQCRSRSSSPSYDGSRSRESSPGSGYTDTANDDKKSQNDSFMSENVIAEENQEISFDPQENNYEIVEEPTDTGLDNEIIEILGVDPSLAVENSQDINAELASRLQHIATTGLTKESRKELNGKYFIPANSPKIGAPSMNPEIKAALTETNIKRDNGIEMRQKQLARAISGLAAVLSQELHSDNKDNNRSKQLMDVCRILCDIQHAESVIRRNFAIYSIKKELKEHIVNTKIDRYLFGENLAETLKSAKALTKSGTELKTKPTPKPRPPAPAGNLNWKSPAPPRRPPQGAGRGRGPAPTTAPGPAVRPTRSMPHASSFKTSYYPHKQNRRR